MATLLIVDDDDGFSYSTKKFLETNGYHVLTAGDLPSALAQLSSHKIDLLIADMSMPNSVGGLSIARIFRERQPTMPVIFVTAFDVPSSTEIRDLILRKPLNASELLREIKIRLNPPAAP